MVHNYSNAAHPIGMSGRLTALRLGESGFQIDIAPIEFDSFEVPAVGSQKGWDAQAVGLIGNRYVRDVSVRGRIEA
jgi:hypothetical protein